MVQPGGSNADRVDGRRRGCSDEDAPMRMRMIDDDDDDNDDQGDDESNK
jgi:hypothetical protein